MSPAARAIFNEVLNKRQLTLEDVTGRSHLDFKVLARIEIANRLRNELKYSYTKIGQLLNRDHTTIIFYCGRNKQKPACLRRIDEYERICKRSPQ